MSKRAPAQTVTAPAALDQVGAVVPPPEASAAEAPPLAGALSIMTVRCTRLRGIWRAGRFWPPEAVPVFDGDLSAEQLKAVRAEPLLIVREMVV